MSTYRELRATPFKPAAQPAKEVGRRPDLVMLPIDRLVVDDTYQRSITPRGRSNILRIIEEFDWRKFAPLIVVPVDDGRYAIIDGQHRATAALMHPKIDLVPCMVIEATVEEAASCFAAINGAVTAMTLGQMFHARAASGEHFASSVRDLCTRAGVTILKHKAGADSWKPGETLAVGSIEAAVKTHGDAYAEAGLAAIARNGNVDMLRATVIKAVVAIVADLRLSVDDAVSAFRPVKLGQRLVEANQRSIATRQPAWKVMVEILRPVIAGNVARQQPKVLEPAE